MKIFISLASNFDFSAYMPPDVAEALKKAIKAAQESGNPAARTYANAMTRAADEHGSHGLAMQIAYLLSNLKSWKGDEARAVKKILTKWALAN